MTTRPSPTALDILKRAAYLLAEAQDHINGDSSAQVLVLRRQIVDHIKQADPAHYGLK